MKKQFFFMIFLASIMYIVQQITLQEIEELPLSEPTPIEIFMEMVAEIESGGNYKVVNQIGMMGKYQFSPRTVRSLGFNITREEFLGNPLLQDSVMVAYMRLNDQELSNLIRRYEGTTHNGVLITRAGIIAGAHFAGTGGMRRYLASRGQDTTVDINGTHIQQYISRFSDFHLPALSSSDTDSN
jgi:hypothetical protein